MSEQANISKLQQMYAAFGRGDIQTIASECTDDVSWGTDTVAQAEVPWYRIRSGRDGVLDFFTTLASEVDFEKFEPNLWAASGDQVLVRLDYTYRFKKNGNPRRRAASTRSRCAMGRCRSSARTKTRRRCGTSTSKAQAATSPPRTSCFDPKPDRTRPRRRRSSRLEGSRSLSSRRARGRGPCRSRGPSASS